MARARRERQREEDLAHLHGRREPDPAPEAEEEIEDAPQRAAAALGNRGFATLARAGAGVLPDGRAHPDVEAAVALARGGGRPLDARDRRLGARVGAPVEDVRVHDGPDAAALARAVDARAFAVGRDLFFGEGERRPGTPEGDGLMAHELAHAAQAPGEAPAGPLTVSRPGDPAEREADALSASAAAAPALRRQPRGAPAQTITFDEDEALVVEGHVRVLEPSARGSGEQEVMNQVDRVGGVLRNTQTALLAAIDQFGRDQAFSSSAEGEADFNGAFLSWATEQILSAVVEQVGERLPYFSKVYELTFGLIKTLKEEDERAATARGSRAVAEFLGRYTAQVTNAFNARLDALPDVKNALVLEYQRAGAAEPELSRPTMPAAGGPGAQPAVAGESARFLNELRSLADRLRTPSFEQCLQTIVEGWVAQSAGQVKSRGGGDIYVDGRILISMKLYRDGDSWEVVEKPTGKLQAPRADHVIDSLKTVFGNNERSVNDLAIKKAVTITVEDEIDWGFNDWYEVTFAYTRPGRYENLMTIGHPVREERVHRRASEIQAKVLDMVKPERDFTLTDLTAAPEGR